MSVSSEPRFIHRIELHNDLNRFSTTQRSVLDRINRQVAENQTIRQVVDFLFEQTGTISPCDRVSVAFVSDDDCRVESYYTRSGYSPTKLNTGYVEDLAGSSLERILKEGTVRVIDDLAAYAKANPESRSSRVLVEEGVRSSLTCPLVVDNRHVGFLFRSSRTPHAYDGVQVAMHGAIGERLGPTVEKAYRIEQLEKANKAYFEMLAFVTHELKSPLAAIMTDANLMLEGYLGDLPPEHRDRLEKMNERASFLMELVRDYLELSRVESGALEVSLRRDVPLVSEVIGPAVEVSRPQMEEAGVRFVLDAPKDDLCSDCDPILLRIVMINLLGNAVKYGRQGGEVRVAVTLRADRTHVSVWNEGPGFSPHERGKLFKKFSRLSAPELMKQKGTGVGLYTCWKIVGLHGGRIDANSEPGQWAEFSFEWPCRSVNNGDLDQ